MTIPITLKPHDFKSEEGQKKVIALIHDMDVRIRHLEKILHELAVKEKSIEKDIREIIKADDVGPSAS